MLRIPALLVVTYCAAFVLTSAVAAPERLRESLAQVEHLMAGLLDAAASEFAAAEPVPERDPRAVEPAPRALVRADPWGPAVSVRAKREATAAGEIELADRGALAIRDGDGNLVFLHDPAARTTVVARGAAFPRLLSEPAGDAPRLRTEPPRPSGETEPVEAPDERLAPGCESAVSPLARTDVVRQGVLCLARL